MRTGSHGLWTLAAAFGLVPVPPDNVLAHRLADWWSLPRSFGCTSAAASATWTVVCPRPEVWCAACAVRVFEATWACAYCGRRVARRKAVALMFEMTGNVQVLGRAHRSCGEAAGRARAEEGT